MELQTIEDLVEKKGYGIDYTASEYAEKGYSKEDATDVILFANWNGLPKYIMNAIVRRYTIEWSDEWSMCGNCSKAFRVSGDSYGWKPYYAVIGNEYICGDCIKEDPTDYLETLIDNHNECDSILGDLTKHGFTLFNDEYENGLYPGQNDNPFKILEAAKNDKPDCEFIFGNMSNGQFDTHFSLYYRKK